MLSNSYYGIAFDTLGYLQLGVNTDFFNVMTILCFRVSESALKSVAELYTDDDKIFKSTNLRGINNIIRDKGIDLDLDDTGLVFLKYFYTNARYPGETFIEVKEYEFIRALKVMYKILNSVNKFRTDKGLPVLDINEKYPDSYASNLS